METKTPVKAKKGSKSTGGESPSPTTLTTGIKDPARPLPVMEKSTSNPKTQEKPVKRVKAAEEAPAQKDSGKQKKSVEKKTTGTTTGSVAKGPRRTVHKAEKK